MDPQSTLYDLLDCCFRNDRQGFDQALTDLRNWNRCGGFLPSVDRPGSQSVAHYVVRRKITEAGPLPEDLGSALGEDEFTPHYIHPAVEDLVRGRRLSDGSRVVGEGACPANRSPPRRSRPVACGLAR
jgi:hypothetical protein